MINKMYSISDWILFHIYGWSKFDRRADLKIKKQIIEGNNHKAVFCFPFWLGKSSCYNKIIKMLGDSYTFVLYDYPKEVLSKDAQVSVNYIKRIINDAKCAIEELKKKGITEVTLIGTSFGSDVALKLADSVKVDKVVLNMLDTNFALSSFESPVMSGLKRYYQRQGITLHQLDKLYHFISPEYNLGNLKKYKPKMLIFAARNDIFCTYEELKPLIRKIEDKGVPVEFHLDRMGGHILNLVRHLWFPNRIVEFIREY
jgi:esterase/lipase